MNITRFAYFIFIIFSLSVFANAIHELTHVIQVASNNDTFKDICILGYEPDKNGSILSSSAGWVSFMSKEERHVDETVPMLLGGV